MKLKPHYSLFLFLLGTIFISFVYSTDEQRPNIIFILADDQRNDLLGCAGHPIVQTPTIDKLAEQGVRFENAFVTTPICAASRASIFTGLYERHHGFTFGKPPVSVENGELSYPALLKKAGYRSGYIGKQHAQFQNPNETHATMFDSFEPVSSKKYLVKDKEGNDRHETELCGELAIKFIEDTPVDQPFVLSVGFFAAHAVDSDHRLGHHFESLPELKGMYVDGEVPEARLDREEERAKIPYFLRDSMNRTRWTWRWDSQEKYDSNIRDYYRLVSGIDLTVARILKALEDRGQVENTIVIYSADNGYLMGDRGMAGKWNHYEQSLRVPMIVFDPRLDAEKRGKVLSEMTLNIDLAPTMLEYAGVDIPETYDGQSLKSLVDGGQQEEWRDAFYCEHGMVRSTIPRWSGVRTDRYKYAIYHDYSVGGYECLYDLSEDPDELNNLADQPNFQELLLEMRELFKDFQSDIPEAHPLTPETAFSDKHQF